MPIVSGIIHATIWNLSRTNSGEIMQMPHEKLKQFLVSVMGNGDIIRVRPCICCSKLNPIMSLNQSSESSLAY